MYRPLLPPPDIFWSVKGADRSSEARLEPDGYNFGAL